MIVYHTKYFSIHIMSFVESQLVSSCSNTDAGNWEQDEGKHMAFDTRQYK